MSQREDQEITVRRTEKGTSLLTSATAQTDWQEWQEHHETHLKGHGGMQAVHAQSPVSRVLRDSSSRRWEWSGSRGWAGRAQE